MTPYKVTYIRTVYETYEATIEANSEDAAMDIVLQAKYGEPIADETLLEAFSDTIEVDDVEVIE